MTHFNTPTRRLIVAVLAPLMLAASGGLANAQTVDRNDILYIMPFSTVGPNIAELRARLAPSGEGSYVRLGFADYVFLQMMDWNVDVTNPDAVKAAIAGGIAEISARVATARNGGYPVAFVVRAGIKDEYDPAQRASEAEDIRSMQWYADNVLARGWWSYSRYARKKHVVQQAYMREVAKEIARQMRDNPDTLIAASGDAEVELARARQSDLNDQVYADYSPFTVAEFRDWVRLGGLYAPGGELAGQGFAFGARYAGDLSPAADTNGDGHTFNGDFQTGFTTWNLKHFDWSLDDPFMSNDPGAISLATYESPGFNRSPAQIPTGFDPPRAAQNSGGSPFWELWVTFKQTLVHRYNVEFARWMTTTPAAADGASAGDAGYTIPPERWYSYQIPADLMFQCSSPDCATPNDRWYSSMSSWWTADIAPYGSLGITAFNVDWTILVARTLIAVAPEIAKLNRRWGILEWHPGVLGGDTGVSTNLDLFRSEMTLIERYRPNLVQPFMWGLPNSEVMGTPFETALRELISRIKDGKTPSLVIDPLPNGTRSKQPLTLTGWAADFNKSPGGGPGIDQVDIYRSQTNGDPAVLVGSATFGIARPDVSATYGGQFGNAGFSLTVPTLPLGTYQFEVRGHSTVTQTFNVSATRTVELVSFLGPSSGGPDSGTVNGSTLRYDGVDYPILGGRVYFPDCTNYMVMGNGLLILVQTTPDCTPGSGITPTEPTLTWPTPASVVVGTTLSATQLNATANVPGTFAYSPSLGSVLGTVGSRTLSVTFTPADTTTYTNATATVTIVVTAPITPTITWASPASIVTGIPLSATQLNATANVPGAFVYSPAAGSVLELGTQTLSTTFTPTDSLNYTTATRTATIVVTPPIAPVVTWANPAAVMSGTALSATQLNATANVPGTFSYTPAAGAVLAPGTQTLATTFTPSDSITYTAATAVVTMVVTAPTAPTITWANPASVEAGTALGATQLNASADVPGTFIYSPAAGAVLSVGTQTLATTFTPTDTTNYTTVTKTVLLVVTGDGGGAATPTITWGDPAPVMAGTALSATQLNATASAAGSVVYTPPVGTVLPAGQHTLAVTFTPTDTTAFTVATKSVTIVVTAPTTPIITWENPAGVIAGTALSSTQLNATANVPGSFVYAPVAGTVLSAGTQTLATTFTPTDLTTYSTATKFVTFVVTAPVTPTITWANPASVVAGTPLGATQLNATTAVPGTFVYTPPATTTLSVGTQTLSVVFTPTDPIAYTTATRLVTIVVTPAPVAPAIAWATPAGIIQGIALGAAQLNATANVPGTFVYNPASGVVLSAGTHTLSTTFTPNDTAAYTTATRSVSIVVTSFVGPSSGGGSYGTVSGGSLIYNGVTYPIVGLRVYFPDCKNYMVGPGGLLFLEQPTANCTPAGGGGGGGGTTAPTISWATPTPVVAGTQLNGAQLNATANVSGSFSYSPVAGTTLTAGMQPLTVTFTPTDTATYSTATASVTISVTSSGGGGGTFLGPANGGGSYGTVSGGSLIYNGVTYPIVGLRVYFPDCTNYMVGPGGVLFVGQPTPNCTPAGGGGGGGTTTPTITWATPAPIAQGTALSGAQLNATANVPGSFSYSPVAGTTLTAGMQPLTVTFTPTDTATYSTATASVTISVTSSGGGGGTFLGPANGGGSYGTVSGGSLIYNGVTYPIVGLRVYFPDCTNYMVGPGGVLFVGQPTPNCTPAGGGGGGGTTAPTITWATPAPIAQGTALSVAQLNASSGGVSGTFVYSPPATTVLPAGTQPLTVTFTPIDTATYSTATATVTISVTPSGGGGGFVRPATGTMASVSGGILSYNGATYAIVNGKVTFPDGSVFYAMDSGMLIFISAPPS